MNGSGRVIIVTGGINGIGRTVTMLLARRGYRVVSFGLNATVPGSTARDGIAQTQAALEQAGLSADLFEADVSVASHVDRVVRSVMERHGRIDGLVNNAAIRPAGSILATSEEMWDRVFAVNLKGMFLCTKAVLPHMIAGGGGTIVNIGSGAGWGRPELLAYSASKGGVIAFSLSLARDHLKDRVRVNVVIPGPTMTGQMESIPDYQSLLPSVRNAAGRNNTPDDVAHTVAFLMSPEAEAISGAVIDVGAFYGRT